MSLFAGVRSGGGVCVYHLYLDSVRIWLTVGIMCQQVPYLSHEPGIAHTGGGCSSVVTGS